jgi:hypothetical protein
MKYYPRYAQEHQVAEGVGAGLPFLSTRPQLRELRGPKWVRNSADTPVSLQCPYHPASPRASRPGSPRIRPISAVASVLRPLSRPPGQISTVTFSMLRYLRHVFRVGNFGRASLGLMDLLCYVPPVRKSMRCSLCAPQKAALGSWTEFPMPCTSRRWTSQNAWQCRDKCFEVNV